MSIVGENSIPGHGPENWLQIPNGSTEVMPAFSRSTYFQPGSIATFSVNYSSAFTGEIFRLGNYAGAGARRITIVTGTPTTQPSPSTIPGSNGAVDCSSWSVNIEWNVPSNTEPGWYYLLLVNTARTDFNHVLFCVTDKLSKKPVVIVTGDATWHAAYSGFGSNNVYGASKAIGTITDRAFCSSYDKPVLTRDQVPQTHFLNNTYPYLKWSERMGYEAGCTTIEQINNDPSILDDRELIVWTGHNEYISQIVMDKTKALLSAGQNMVNIAGNDFFWRIRFGGTSWPSSDTSTGRVMWCRKDTMPGPTTGPNSIPSHDGGVSIGTEAEWTGTWQDTRWPLREPSEDFFGDQFIANGIRNDAVKVPSSMKVLPPWRNCPGIQALADGTTYTFVAGSLGMEWDRPKLDNPNVDQILFSSTEVDLIGNASDVNGQNYGVTSDDTIHGFSMVLNGTSRIANYNSDQWPWALDYLHLRGNAIPDINAMQMMLNVIADLGILPDSGSVSAASLTYPVPVSDFNEAYGFDSVDEEPVGDFFMYTYDGTSLIPYLYDGTKLTMYKS